MKNNVKFIIIVFIIMSTFFMINNANSRYLSSVDITEDVNVAIPRVVLDTSNSIDEQILPGSTLSYEFYVENYEGSNINEVLMEYYIKINITQDNLPLTYKVYNISGNSETELTETTDGFGPVTLNYGEMQDNNYRIDFIWDENDNSAEYANKQFNFTIELNAEQVLN